GNTAESYKPAVAEGSGRAQTFRTILTVSSTATVVLTVDNTMVMATVDYVDDKLKEHEQSRRHPDASLTAKGFVQLSSATNSVSETQAATPKAVKAAYDLANGKYTAQDASTTRKGLVQLSSATNSTSETQAATPKAVKAAYDLANAKYTAQDATTAQKGIVQLSSATNSTSETLAATSKAVKAVMDETNKKAPLNSPALTGTPTTPTARQGTNNTQIASTAFVMAAIAALVDSSPDALNTLNELAAALGNDPNFATTMTNALAGKQPKDATLTALAGLTTAAGKFPYFTGNDVASLATLTKVGRDILAKSTVAAVIEYLGLRELGTSGEKIPLLSTANTWTNRQTFSGGLSGELSGNASTAAKLKTARKISNVAFDGSSDITLKASHVGAFALGKTGSTVANDKAVGWNWSSGAYNANIGGASTLIIHFYMGDGSCPAAQFRINYKNGGIFYRSARDGYGFEADWSEFYTTTRKPSAGDVGALPLSGGQLNGALGIGTSSALGGNSIVLGDNDTGFKQNGDGNLDVYANYVHVMRFVPGSIQSNKTINITGRVNPSDYGNFDSRYVKDVRLGSQQYYGVNNWRTWNFQCPSGHVLSGINVQDTGSNSADNIAGVYYRPVQKYINGTWYNVASV
ncbi:phage tail protein, partial [Escherichia coli]|nr:phage tail protein [Escherichia coli]